jgi:hypothetical protein
MRKVRNITVAVDPELYRQTRRLAAEYNTSVTDRLRFLLLAMPEALAFSSPTLNAKDAFRMGHPAMPEALAFSSPTRNAKDAFRMGHPAMPEALAFSSPTQNAKDAFRMGHPACSLVLAKRQRQKQPQILRLTTPELKDVRGPVRSG